MNDDQVDRAVRAMVAELRKMYGRYAAMHARESLGWYLEGDSATLEDGSPITDADIQMARLFSRVLDFLCTEHDFDDEVAISDAEDFSLWARMSRRCSRRSRRCAGTATTAGR